MGGVVYFLLERKTEFTLRDNLVLPWPRHFEFQLKMQSMGVLWKSVRVGSAVKLLVDCSLFMVNSVEIKKIPCWRILFVLNQTEESILAILSCLANKGFKFRKDTFEVFFFSKMQICFKVISRIEKKKKGTCAGRMATSIIIKTNIWLRDWENVKLFWGYF